MAEQVINLTFPVKESILLTLKETKDEFIRDLLFFAALGLYRRRKLTLGKAAELAGYDKIAFINKLRENGEHIFDYTPREIKTIITDAEKIR